MTGQDVYLAWRGQIAGTPTLEDAMNDPQPEVLNQLPTRAQRLDRLKFGREHGKLLVGSGVGWALDAMDVGLISYVMTALAVHWNLSNTQLSWIGSAGCSPTGSDAETCLRSPCWSTGSPRAWLHSPSGSRC